jgi:hypothetical protein
MSKRLELTNGTESIAIEDMTLEQLFAERARMEYAVLIAPAGEGWQRYRAIQVDKQIRKLTL